jgi:hypothetical protein
MTFLPRVATLGILALIGLTLATGAEALSKPEGIVCLHTRFPAEFFTNGTKGVWISWTAGGPTDGFIVERSISGEPFEIIDTLLPPGGFEKDEWEDSWDETPVLPVLGQLNPPVYLYRVTAFPLGADS